MIRDASPVVQALLGTLFTWAMTAFGASAAFFFRGDQRNVLDGSLGSAAGVMLAASFWSLLQPGIDMAKASGNYGDSGQLAFIPVCVGLILGAAFLHISDLMITRMGVVSPQDFAFQASGISPNNHKEDSPIHSATLLLDDNDSLVRRRARRHRSPSSDSAEEGIPESEVYELQREAMTAAQWKRILMLIIAITIHNIPEGLAVGIAFGAAGNSSTATFETARNLAIGIGLQNFPEGLAVSLPLKAAGFSAYKSIWYGQLSGLVEIIAGVFGALMVTWIEPIQPYAFGFAAGAMIFVVFDDIVPEAHSRGNGKIGSWCGIFGFCMMMCLEVGLV